MNTLLRFGIRIVLLFLVPAFATACAKGWNDQIPETPTKDAPCGVGVPCLDMNGELNHLCCGEYYTCGGGKFSVGCGPGDCCFIGSPLMELSRDGGTSEAGARLPIITKQFYPPASYEKDHP